ncbi:hypoxia-inducible lipid droplet-associated protein isoform 1 [Mus musculus]|nr:hypoxia-inducible lipid droplet-associated protein isoform 1 [Mus musculus]|eukprot:NP_001177390.1 hypoxia-inducible lipid droplet-associated protein isoform 1 [Mus musculus]
MASGRAPGRARAGSSSRKQLYFPAKELGTVAMKFMLNLYVLGIMLTLLSIFVRVMESLGGLLESPLPGSSWITRGQLANTQPPKGLPDHPSRGVQ